MKRYIAIREILSALTDIDIAIFSNADIGKEAFEYDKEGHFYIADSHGLAVSIATGMAMHTNKRIFVFIEDWDFLMEFNAAAQMAVSKCKNVFIVLLGSGHYKCFGGHPTIFENLPFVKGVMSGLGFIVYDFSHYFKSKKELRSMAGIIDRIRGPAVILLDVDQSEYKNKGKKISHSKEKFKNRIMEFLKNPSSSLFVPPVPIPADAVEGGTE